MEKIKIFENMNKGGDGNKGFNALRVFEAFASQDMAVSQ